MRMKGRSTLGTLALACSLAVPAVAAAQDNPPGGSGGMQGGTTDHKGDTKGDERSDTSGRNVTPLPHKDREFVDKAAMGSMLEVKLGQLAVGKTQNPTVKQFAQQMVDDHNKVNDQLKTIARQKGVMLPAQLDSKAQADYDRLSKLDGQEFDRAYMKRMADDHQMDISDFQKEADSGKDADLKQFARQTLPTLKMHNDMARRDRKML